MTAVRGIKRIGPKPKFAPIIVTAKDAEENRRTINAGLFIRRTSPRDQHVHHSEASGGRAPDPVKRPYKFWGYHDTEALKQMCREGRSLQEVAQALDRKESSVNRQLKRLRIEDPSLPCFKRKRRNTNHDGN